MSWLLASTEVDGAQAASLADALEPAGALAVWLEAAEEGDAPEAPWRRTRVTGLFPAGADLGSALAGLGAAGWRVEGLADADWEARAREPFAPRCFAMRLWVRPSWAPPAGDGLPEVVLDPGLAFGTGSHATTALCLEWLAAQPLAACTVIDYGCGSGILAIAAARLGAGEVWAVDTDPAAITVARSNVAANGLAAHVRVASPQALPRVRAGVLVANILLDPLRELAPRFAALAAPGARIALCGVTVAQAQRCAAAYQAHFDLEVARCRAGWALLAGRRRERQRTSAC